MTIPCTPRRRLEEAAPLLHSNGHAVPPTSAPFLDHVRPEAGAVLSPSQTNTWLSCPARWMFKNLLELPDPQNAARFVGSCVHKSLEANWRARIARQPMEAGDVMHAFDLAWAANEETVAWTTDDKPGELRAEGHALVEVYLIDVAPSIEPAAVEVPVSGIIAGVPVRGIIDLLDTEGRIIDVKTAKKRPSGIRPDYRLQVATYDALCPAARGEARLDTLVKTKSVQTVQHTITLGASDVQYVEAVYPMVRDAIQDAIYYPRRDSALCTRRYCAYWQACIREFGGEVAA